MLVGHDDFSCVGVCVVNAGKAAGYAMAMLVPVVTVVTNNDLADVGNDEKLNDAVAAALRAITGKLVVKYEPGRYGARRF